MNSFTLSSEDAAAVRSGPQSSKKYLSVAERPIVFEARVAAPNNLTDPVSNGYYGITYDTPTGDLADVRVGMSLDIGGTPGSRENGTLRIRATPTVSALFVNEVAPGEAAFAPGAYLTVREEYLIRQRMPRLVATKTGGAKYNNDFVEYHDYDTAYINQNHAIQPIINVAEEVLEDGTIIPFQAAGWVDTGQTYRTVRLTVEPSLILSPGGAVASILWDVKDGVIVVGDETSETILAQFPASQTFRILYVTLTDTLGAVHTRPIPIWVHDTDHPPVTAFHVTRDERSNGREMGFELWGDEGEFNRNILPENSLICYWETPYFGGEVPPRQYVREALLWTTREATTLRRGRRSRVSVDAAGAAYWLDKINGFAQDIIDKATPNKWYYMSGVTVDKVAHYVLRETTTALSCCNLYLTGNTDAVKQENIKQGNIWGQISELISAVRHAEVRVDSSNGIWLRPHWSIVDNGQRIGVDPVLLLSGDDLLDEQPLQLGEEYTQKTPSSAGQGSAYNGTASAVFYSIAPGKVAGSVPGGDTAPFQRLPNTDAQGLLNQLTGYYYARANNQRVGIQLALQGNLDILEPAWMRHIRIQWLPPNVRDQYVVADFIVTSVSVQHGTERGQPDKRLTWTVDEVTSGVAAETDDPPPSNPIPPVVPPADLQFPSMELFPPPVEPNPELPPEEIPEEPDPELPLPLDGNSALVTSPDNVFLSLLYRKTADVAQWYDVTPPALVGEWLDAQFEGVKGAYAVCSDSISSRLFHTDDILQTPVVWDQTDLDGMYFLIRVPPVADNVVLVSCEACVPLEPPDEPCNRTINFPDSVLPGSVTIHQGEHVTVGGAQPPGIQARPLSGFRRWDVQVNFDPPCTPRAFNATYWLSGTSSWGFCYSIKKVGQPATGFTCIGPNTAGTHTTGSATPPVPAPPWEYIRLRTQNDTRNKTLIQINFYP